MGRKNNSGSGCGCLVIIIILLAVGYFGKSDNKTTDTIQNSQSTTNQIDAKKSENEIVKLPTSQVAKQTEPIKREVVKETPTFQPSNTGVYDYNNTSNQYNTYRQSSSSSEEKTVHVKGYYRKDGTYVKPYMRRSPKR